MKNLTPSSTPTHQLAPIEHTILHERIRQARNTSNLALITTALSTGFSLLGACILLTGKVPAGTLTTAIGLITNVHCIHLSVDANDRLDNLLAELEDED